jgi:exodeoxyribonuclease VII large subunit
MEFTVSKLNQNLKSLINLQFPNNVIVLGEISNLKGSHGHAYLSLKDSSSLINAVMWKSVFSKYKDLKNGDKVKAKGKIDVYAKTGQYQLYISEIELDGVGDLHKQYTALKRKYQDLGYFDEERKKKIPKVINNVGIVTSSGGAALQDILSVFNRNNIKLKVDIKNCKVQGTDCHQSISKSIDYFQNQDVDLILVSRGGGSFEDLMGFSHQDVIESIYKSNVPVISGVGHEVDFMLSDFVSDLRCATPSVAAEKITSNIVEINQKIEDYFTLFNVEIFEKIDNLKQKLVNINLLNPKEKIVQLKNKIDTFGNMFQKFMEQEFDYNSLNLKGVEKSLQNNNPNNILSRGYSIVYKNDEIITNKKDIKVGDQLKIKMNNGEVVLSVSKIN